jgi:hypothetical protein
LDALKLTTLLCLSPNRDLGTYRSGEAVLHAKFKRIPSRCMAEQVCQAGRPLLGPDRLKAASTRLHVSMGFRCHQVLARLGIFLASRAYGRSGGPGLSPTDSKSASPHSTCPRQVGATKPQLVRESKWPAGPRVGRPAHFVPVRALSSRVGCSWLVIDNLICLGLCG